MIAAALAFLPGFGALKRWALIGAIGTAALVASFGAGWLVAKMDARAARKIAELQARNAALTFDLKTARELADLAFAQTKNQESETLSLEQKVEAYEAVLAARPDRACVLTDDDVGGLRGIHP